MPSSGAPLKSLVVDQRGHQNVGGDNRQAYFESVGTPLPGQHWGIKHVDHRKVGPTRSRRTPTDRYAGHHIAGRLDVRGNHAVREVLSGRALRRRQQSEQLGPRCGRRVVRAARRAIQEERVSRGGVAASGLSVDPRTRPSCLALTDVVCGAGRGVHVHLDRLQNLLDRAHAEVVHPGLLDHTSARTPVLADISASLLGEPFRVEEHEVGVAVVAILAVSNALIERLIKQRHLPQGNAAVVVRGQVRDGRILLSCGVPAVLERKEDLRTPRVSQVVVAGLVLPPGVGGHCIVHVVVARVDVGGPQRGSSTALVRDRRLRAIQKVAVARYLTDHDALAHAPPAAAQHVAVLVNLGVVRHTAVRAPHNPSVAVVTVRAALDLVNQPVLCRLATAGTAFVLIVVLPLAANRLGAVAHRHLRAAERDVAILLCNCSVVHAATHFPWCVGVRRRHGVAATHYTCPAADARGAVAAALSCASPFPRSLHSFIRQLHGSSVRCNRCSTCTDQAFSWGIR